MTRRRNTESRIYQGLRVYNDLNAVRRGRVVRRAGRRVYGKAAGRLARRLFG